MEEALRRTSVVVLVAALVAGACSNTGAETVATLNVDGAEHPDPGLAMIETDRIGLTDAEENWCATHEGSAGAWLVANESDLIVDAATGQPDALDLDTVRLLETVQLEGTDGIPPDQLEDLDTFLRHPIPSPLACKTAFDIRSD